MSDHVNRVRRTRLRAPSKRALLADTMRLSGLTSLLLRRARWQGVVVLSYHRIGEAASSQLFRGVFSTTPQGLGEQLGLLRRHFEVVSPTELESAVADGEGRRVMVTFDDGYRDLYEAAFPVLEAHAVKATMFVCPGFIDGQAYAWWDEIAWMLRHSRVPDLPAGRWSPDSVPLADGEDCVERAIGLLTRHYWQLDADAGPAFLDVLAAATGAGRRPEEDARADWITWDMAREMQTAGHCIGAHTLTHPLLSRLPAERQLKEIAGSVERIAAQLGEPPRVLAYPVGLRAAFTAESQDAARRAGIRLAFSNYGGRVTRSTFTALDVRRTSAEMLHSENIFAATLAWPQMFVREEP